MIPQPEIDVQKKLRFAAPQWLRGRQISAVGFVFIFGFSGIVYAAVQQYYSHEIKRSGNESIVHVQVYSPAGSLALYSGTKPGTLTFVESEGDEGSDPDMHLKYTMRGTIGHLQINIGDDEGQLQNNPPLAMWRANTGLGFAGARSYQTDAGSAPSWTNAVAFVPSSASSSSELSSSRQLSSSRPLVPISNMQNRYAPASPVYVPASPVEVIEPKAYQPDPQSSGIHTKVFLTQEIPITLQTEFGFGESFLNLTGLKIQDMLVETGASKAQLFMSQQNAINMGTCKVNAGVGQCSFEGISNLNASRFEFSGGLGVYHLGFGGKLTRNMEAIISVGLGKVTISIPPDAGRVQVFYDDGLFSSFQFSGLVQRSDGYATSVGFDHSTAPVLTLRLSSGMGKMTVDYH